MTTTTWADVREFLAKEGYELRLGPDGTAEVRRLRKWPQHGLFLRTYKTPANALRGIGYEREFEEWRLARWQQEATRT